MRTADATSGQTGIGEQYHVLVVDDSRPLATVVAESLEHVDSQLTTAYTTEPREALDRLRAEPVDCLVTDYEMPGIDGLSLVDEIGGETPFVVFTQRRDERVADRARDRGGAYLRKRADGEQYHRLASLVHEQLAD